MVFSLLGLRACVVCACQTQPQTPQHSTPANANNERKRKKNDDRSTYFACKSTEDVTANNNTDTSKNWATSKRQKRCEPDWRLNESFMRNAFCSDSIITTAFDHFGIGTRWANRIHSHAYVIHRSTISDSGPLTPASITARAHCCTFALREQHIQTNSQLINWFVGN